MDGEGTERTWSHLQKLVPLERTSTVRLIIMIFSSRMTSIYLEITSSMVAGRNDDLHCK
jgi:hypothetical protein